MVFKQTRVSINDTSGYIMGKVFHTYSRYGYVRNGYVYLSIRSAYNRSKSSIGKKKRAFVFLLKKNRVNLDNSTINFRLNKVVILKKRLSILGKFTKGPIRYNIKKTKLITSFAKIIICLII